MASKFHFSLYYFFPHEFLPISKPTCLSANLPFPRNRKCIFPHSFCLSFSRSASELDQVNAYCIWQQHRLISRQLFICQMPNLRWQLDKQEKSWIGKVARKESIKCRRRRSAQWKSLSKEFRFMFCSVCITNTRTVQMRVGISSALVGSLTRLTVSRPHHAPFRPLFPLCCCSAARLINFCSLSQSLCT